MLFLSALGLGITGCGQDKELDTFKTQINDFCESISQLDTDINNIDATDNNASTELLGYHDHHGSRNLRCLHIFSISGKNLIIWRDFLTKQASI